jgi:methylaspartate mutase sigma subunit
MVFTEPVARTDRRVLLSTVSSDSHTWNLVYLQLWLQEHGCEVVNLGPCVPVALLVETAAALRPDLVVISSVNGHGHIDGLKAITALRADARTRPVPAVIGGKLGIHGEMDPAQSSALVSAGYDAVFWDAGTAESGLRDFLDRLDHAPALPRVPVHAGGSAA